LVTRGVGVQQWGGGRFARRSEKEIIQRSVPQVVSDGGREKEGEILRGDLWPGERMTDGDGRRTDGGRATMVGNGCAEDV